MKQSLLFQKILKEYIPDKEFTINGVALAITGIVSSFPVSLVWTSIYAYEISNAAIILIFPAGFIYRYLKICRFDICYSFSHKLLYSANNRFTHIHFGTIVFKALCCCHSIGSCQLYGNSSELECFTVFDSLRTILTEYTAEYPGALSSLVQRTIRTLIFRF